MNKKPIKKPIERLEYNKEYDKTLIGISLTIVLAVVLFLGIFPEKGTEVADLVFGTLTEIFGAPVLLFTFGILILLVYIAFSKYGKIKLGEKQPQFSTFSWIAMILTAGLGSATVYWAFTEWAFYFNTPGLNVEPQSNEAYEFGLSYNFFHWGINAWAIYAIATLPIAYHFYVRKNKGLSLSSVVSEITGINPKGPWGKLVDIIFIFTCLAGLSITLGLSVPLLSQAVASILNIENSFGIDLTIILLISIVFSLSSYLGVEKGIKRLTNFNSLFAIVFIGLIFIIGPTIFIMNSSTNGLGLMFQNFIHMNLFTDPIEGGSFPNDWTIFYWLYWVTYAPFMGVFITRVSRGRTIKSLILNMLISGSAGCWIFFGILQNFSMDRHIKGIVDVAGRLDVDGGNQAIIDVLNTLPFPTFFVLFFIILSMLFLASTLDSASYTLAATATKNLKSTEDPSPFHRLFWSLVTVLAPLTMIFINAPMETVKTAAIVTSIPLIFILIIMIYGWLKWMKEDMANGKFSNDEQDK